jgi:hypothetical protein
MVLSRIIVVVIALVASGCSRQGILDYAGELDARRFVGCWIMNKASLEELQRLGYTQYTNMSDHVVLLNEDGSCVYRTFESFINKSTFEDTGRGEQQQYNEFAGGKSPLWPDGLPEARSWCLWYSNRWPFVSGPYSRTNGVGTQGGEWRPNRWPEWSLEDGDANGKWFKGMYRWERDFRYRIHFDNPHCRGGYYFHVGRSTNDFFLWQSVNNFEARGKGTFTMPIIVFERSTTNAPTLSGH